MTYAMPFTPRPQPGESPLALLRRAAIGNHFLRTTHFVYALDQTFDATVTGLGALARNPERFRSFCHSLGIEAEHLQNVDFARVGHAKLDDLLWQGLRIGIGDLDVRRAKVCIACLAENGYAHADWDHSAAVACEIHGTLLDSRCASCGTDWTHSDSPLHCGCDPRPLVAHSQRCSPAAAALLHKLVSGRDQEGLDRLTALSRLLDEWIDLGVSLSPLGRAEALGRLHDGHWPDLGCDEYRAGTRLHPRVSLAALIDHAGPAIRQHASLLLGRTAAAITATDCLRAHWTNQRAQAVLGIGRLALSRLLHNGVLRGNKDGLIDVATINALLWRLTPDPGAPALGQPLNQLRAGSHHLSTIDLVTAMIDGRMQPGGDVLLHGLAGLRAASPVRRAQEPDQSLTVAQAAFRLGTNSESVRALIRLGLLNGHVKTAHGIRRTTVDAESLSSFDRRYVFASQLSKQLHAAATTLSSRLRHAGIAPISGPGIDGGVTYLFLRAEVEARDLSKILLDPYVSPAGRRRKAVPVETPLTTAQAAELLGLDPRSIALLVRDHWLQPYAHPGHGRRFNRRDVEQLAKSFLTQYVDTSRAAADLGQSRQAFLRTWSISGFAQVRRFLGRLVVSAVDLDRIKTLWTQMATAAEIGAALGRDRTLCPNLHKMGLIQPARVIGSGARKVRLFWRAEPVYVHYRIADSARI